MADIFQIKQKVLTPADGGIHSDPVFFNDAPAVHFVPEHAVIKIRRIFDHIRSKLLTAHHLVLFDIALLRQPLPGNPVKVGNHHVTVIFLHGAHEKPRRLRNDPIVAVQKLDKGSPRKGKSLIARIRYAGIFFMDYAHTAILLCIGIADFAGCILTAVVHQKQLKVAVILA